MATTKRGKKNRPVSRSRKPKTLPDPSPQFLLKALTQAALAAGKVLSRYHERAFKVSEKDGAGLVTEVDLASEKAAMRILKRARPDFTFLSEEASPEAARAPEGGRWILDPLDGTTNFVHGFPMFCVSIAAEWKGQILAGVVHAPILRDTYAAAKGLGARINGKPMRVSKTKNLKDSLLTTGFTYRKDEWLRREMEAFERLSGTARAIRRPGSAALDLAYVARGVFDGFWERRLSPWDVAAGLILVEEAGGRVSNFRDQDFDIHCREIIATNGKLHSDLLKSVETDFCPI